MGMWACYTGGIVVCGHVACMTTCADESIHFDAVLVPVKNYAVTRIRTWVIAAKITLCPNL